MLVLHLGPGALAVAAAAGVSPLRGWGLPVQSGLTVALAVVLTPVELGLLVAAARRVSGRWSVRGIGAVVAYREPVVDGRWCRCSW